MVLAHKPITPKVVEGLYAEAMVLANDARTYFDHEGKADRNKLDPMGRIAFACESLKVTTRLMHVVSWLLVRKAVYAGELTQKEAEAPEQRLGQAVSSDNKQIATLPLRARSIIEASQDLYERVRRLDVRFDLNEAAESPARALLDRLQASI